MPLLLASDLDGTLIPAAAIHADDRGRGAASPYRTKPGRGREDCTESTRAFTHLVQRISCTLMYVTGRHLELALEGIERCELPRPDALACDVGTTLYWWRASGWASDEAYHALVAATDGVGTHARVRRLLEGIDGVVLQEAEKQREFKVSYYVDRPLSADLLREVEARLTPHVRPRLVHSHDPVTGRGLLDVLPAAVGKRTAVRFVADRLGVADDAVVFAGDSGNDRDAILSGTLAVVVGNASSALVAELRDEATRRGIVDRVYFSSAPFAHGVVEGLSHFGLRPLDPGAHS